jgi:hypothetical protein
MRDLEQKTTRFSEHTNLNISDILVIRKHLRHIPTISRYSSQDAQQYGFFASTVILATQEITYGQVYALFIEQLVN